MYINHITIQVKKIVHESRKMSEKTQALIREYYPQGNLGQRLQDFLKEVRGQYEQIVRFYEANSDVLNFRCIYFPTNVIVLDTPSFGCTTFDS